MAPSELDSVDDLAYFYLELFDELGLDSYSLVGTAFGGWIAAEIAVHAPAALHRLALIDAFGIRVGGREDRDIVDVFAISRDELARRLFHDPDLARAEFDLSERSDAEVEVIARNREATARYGWLPYLHNPRLRRRLHRISVATLVLWGAHDGILDTDYGRAYADAIPGAQFELIEGAGHLPHLERPDAVADVLLDFLGSEQLVTPTTRSAR
jgi:pimeloyl-ACP methyl ester carboxylesterase